MSMLVESIPSTEFIYKPERKISNEMRIFVDKKCSFYLIFPVYFA